jgi:hypothetical protein
MEGVLSKDQCCNLKFAWSFMSLCIYQDYGVLTCRLVALSVLLRFSTSHASCLSMFIIDFGVLDRLHFLETNNLLELKSRKLQWSWVLKYVSCLCYFGYFI